MRTFTKDDVKPNFCDGKVTVPSCFHKIDHDSFSGAMGVLEVDFRGAVDFDYKAISLGLFRDCLNLRKVTFRIKPNFSAFCLFRNCPSSKVDVFVADNDLEETKREYGVCKIFNEAYKTDLHFHKIDLNKELRG